MNSYCCLAISKRWKHFIKCNSFISFTSWSNRSTRSRYYNSSNNWTKTNE